MAARLDYETTPIAIDFNRGQPKAAGLRKTLPPVLVYAFCAAGVLLFVWNAARVELDLRGTGKEVGAVEQQIAKLQTADHPLQNPILKNLLEKSGSLAKSKADVVELLDSLARIVPDETSISSLSLTGNSSIRFTALFADTEKTAALIRAVQASGKFKLTEIGRMEKAGAASSSGSSSLPKAESLLPLRADVELAVSAPSGKEEKP